MKRALLRAALAALLCSAPPLASRLGAQDYFVSPSGSDSDPGTLARPFRTLGHSVHHVQAGDTLYLRQGVYREALFVLHGGTPAKPVVFSAYESETPVLAGSDLLEGPWRRASGGIWTTDAPGTVTDLFLDGQELPLARWPAAAAGSPMDAGWATAGRGTTSTVVCDPLLPRGPLGGARVHLIPGLAWVAFSGAVKGSGRGSLTLCKPLGGTSDPYLPKAGNLYFVEGALSLLAQPGGWFQDPDSGRLYLWCPDGLSPALHQVEVARRKLVVLDNGNSHVEFRGLSTFCGGIKINRCAGCRVLGVRQRYVQHFSDIQGYSAENPTNTFYACTAGEWADGSIEGSSGDGLAVSGSGNSVHDMLIHGVARAGGIGAAVALLGQGQRVEHNTFYDSGRYLVNLGSARGGDVMWNDLHDAGLLTHDVGAIYSYQSDGGGMVIAYNRVYKVASIRGIGIYLDNGDSDYVVHHNLVHDCAWSAIELNLPSLCNVVSNNTLWACKHSIWGDGAPHSMTGTVIVDNLSEGTELLVKHRLAPDQGGNGSYLQPPPFFAPGGWTLQASSPARGRGVSLPPYTDSGCGGPPDQGAFAYGCGPAWTAGDRVTPPPFGYPPERETAPAGAVMAPPQTRRAP